MIITSIKPQKKTLNRFNVFVDGQYSFSVSDFDLLKYNLKENREIFQETREQLIKEGEFALVFDKTLKFLSYRPRSEQEIKQYFLRKEIGEETAGLVLKKLRDLKLLDDQAFAVWWVEQRSVGQPKGSGFIRQELRQKGVAKDIAETALKDSRPGETEAMLAEKIALKKAARWLDLPVLEVKKKLYAALAQKGFSYPVIKDTVAKILEKR